MGGVRSLHSTRTLFHRVLAVLRGGLGGALLGMVLLVGGCAEEPAAPERSDPSTSEHPGSLGRPLVFQCTGAEGALVDFRARVRSDSLTLRVPASFGGDTRHLTSVRAASGAKYEGGGAMVWSKGGSAIVAVDGRRFEDCTPAPQTGRGENEGPPGLQFRAIGQEPGWFVEVTDDSLRFAWAYGQHRVSAPRPTKETDEGRITYTAATDRGPVRVVARPRRCTDPMNGRVFSHTVTVTLAGDTHTGCGHPLR
jgi:uncharacterized membrane protein